MSMQFKKRFRPFRWQLLLFRLRDNSFSAIRTGPAAFRVPMNSIWISAAGKWHRENFSPRPMFARHRESWFWARLSQIRYFQVAKLSDKRFAFAIFRIE